MPTSRSSLAAFLFFHFNLWHQNPLIAVSKASHSFSFPSTCLTASACYYMLTVSGWQNSLLFTNFSLSASIEYSQISHNKFEVEILKTGRPIWMTWESWSFLALWRDVWLCLGQKRNWRCMLLRIIAYVLSKLAVGTSYQLRTLEIILNESTTNVRSQTAVNHSVRERESWTTSPRPTFQIPRNRSNAKLKGAEKHILRHKIWDITCVLSIRRVKVQSPSSVLDVVVDFKHKGRWSITRESPMEFGVARLKNAPSNFLPWSNWWPIES